MVFSLELRSALGGNQEGETSMAQWRRFAFFDKEVLKDGNGPWMKVRAVSRSPWRPRASLGGR